MKNNKDYIAVCSRSFSANPILRNIILSKYENVKFNDEGKNLRGKELIQFLKGSTKIIIGLEKIDENIISKLPKLKLISKYGVGTDNIDLKAIKKYNIKLAITKGVNKRSISELILLLILNSLRHIKVINRRAISGKWNNIIGNELSSKTVGIVGFGNIGSDLASILKPFNCKILFYDNKVTKKYKNFNKVSLNKLLSESDIVSINLPLDKSTKNIINKNNIKLMKTNSTLINTARGGLVDEFALLKALKSYKIASAAFDVFVEEPSKNKNLLNLDNFFATTHIGSITKEGIERMGIAAISGLK